MNIVITEIKDSKTLGSDFGSRLLLANQIIEKFTPLFSDEIDRKRIQLNDNMADVSKLKKDVTKYKTDIIVLNGIVKKEKRKNEILNEIDYLCNCGVLYGQNKQIVKNILSTLDSQSVEDLVKNVKVLKGLVKRNIKKIMT